MPLHFPGSNSSLALALALAAAAGAAGIFWFRSAGPEKAPAGPAGPGPPLAGESPWILELPRPAAEIEKEVTAAARSIGGARAVAAIIRPRPARKGEVALRAFVFEEGIQKFYAAVPPPSPAERARLEAAGFQEAPEPLLRHASRYLACLREKIPLDEKIPHRFFVLLGPVPPCRAAAEALAQEP